MKKDWSFRGLDKVDTSSKEFIFCIKTSIWKLSKYAAEAIFKNNNWLYHLFIKEGNKRKSLFYSNDDHLKIKR